MRNIFRRQPKPAPTLYDAIDGDDGRRIDFNRPLNLGQSLSVMTRERKD